MIAYEEFRRSELSLPHMVQIIYKKRNLKTLRAHMISNQKNRRQQGWLQVEEQNAKGIMGEYVQRIPQRFEVWTESLKINPG